MSLDRTLKLHGGLIRSRSVLTRTERIAKLLDDEKFDTDTNSPFGLPKVRVHHSRAGTKGKKAEAKPAEGGAPAEGEAAAVAAAPEAKGPATKAATKAAKTAAKPAEGKGKPQGRR